MMRSNKSFRIISVFCLLFSFVFAFSCLSEEDTKKVQEAIDSGLLGEIATQATDDLAKGVESAGKTVTTEKAEEIVTMIDNNEITINEVADNTAPKFTSILNNAEFPENIGRQNFFAWTNPQNRFKYFYIIVEIKGSDNTVQKVKMFANYSPFTPSKEHWETIKKAALDGAEVSAKIIGVVTDASGNALESILSLDAVKFKIIKQRLEGSIYFWSVAWNISGTGNDNGTIMVMPAYGSTTPTPFYGAGSPKTEYSNFCAGCHAISHDGEKYAIIEHASSNHQDVRFGDININTTAPFREPVDSYSFPSAGTPQEEKTNFIDFNPKDNNWVIYSLKGDLYIKDVSNTSDTGTALSDANDPILVDTMPSWGPGGKIVFVRCQPGNGEMFDLQGPASLYIYTPTTYPATSVSDILAGGTVTKMKIKDSSGTETNNDQNMNYYPIFSPGGKWISFTHHSMGLNNNSTYADPKRNAKQGINVFIVPTSGGTRYSLTPADWEQEYVNTWSTWGKRSQWLIDIKANLDPQITGIWVAFSSNYPLYPQTNPNNDDMNIFMVKVSSLGGSGTPVISPPIPMPNANFENSGEHLPRWTVK